MILIPSETEAGFINGFNVVIYGLHDLSWGKLNIDNGSGILYYI